MALSGNPSWDSPFWMRSLLSTFVVVVCFLELHLPHMEVPRLGVQSELHLPSYTTATATQDLSQVCNLHHSSQQHHILNPLSEARGPTRNLVDPSPVHFHWATIGTPLYFVNSLSLSALYSLLPCTINISLPLSFIRLKILFPGAIV